LIKVVVKSRTELKKAFEATYTFDIPPLFYVISFCDVLEFNDKNDTAVPGIRFTFYLLFSKGFGKLKTRNKVWTFIRNLGILPAILLAVFALALTLLVQGYVSVRVGVIQARSQRDLGIAGIVAAILVIKGAGMAFASGISFVHLFMARTFSKVKM
jgi:hypothetical protein